MKFNKNCFDELLKFIEENLEFEETTAPVLKNLGVIGVLLSDFQKKYDKYAVDEIKYAYYILIKLEYIIEEPKIQDKNSPIISRITKEGYQYLLKNIYKMPLH